ncbi:PAS domain-containing protein, partial [Bacteroides cellulosilyticus]
MADTKDQEYIVLISSSTFREKWAYDLLETVEKAFNEENSVKVYSETLTTWHFNNQQEINQKVDYLKDKYSVPPQAVIFVGDPGWYVCKPLFDTIWKGVPTIICHSMPHTSADINKYYNGEYIPEDQIIATPEMLERYNVTAINIPVCIKETIELMKEITPEMKKVVLLSDDRFICSLIRKKAEDIHQQYFSDLDMEFITYPQTNTETMLRIISECGKETGIIYCSWVNVASQNLSEKYYPDERMHSYISGIVKKPVFSLSDQFTRGHALFAGGHYIGSSDVESIVIGEIRSALKKDGTYEAKTVVAGTPNTYLNYQTLLDKGVALDHFPKNAVYCDVPPSFIQKNIIYVVIVLGTAIVLLLFYFMHKRIKKVRETEWQEHLHLLENILDNLPIAAKVKDVDNDMRYTFINKKAEELFEYPAKEAIGRTDFDIMPEAATMIRKEDEELVRTGIAQFGTRR